MRPLNTQEAWLRRQLKQHTLALTSMQRTIARLRSRIQWLGEGDATTEYFFPHARYRKRKKYIGALTVGDRTLTSHDEKEEAIWEYYNGLLGTAQARTSTLNLQAVLPPGIDMAGLDATITEEEVWMVIKDMPQDKAPGPDGFTGRFYKACWSIIKTDIMAAIGALHGGDSRKLHLVNSALMVLLPKKEDARQIGDYRPISLVHSFAKLVTKIMASRLAPKLDSMIAKNQSAFIKGRRIHDNFMMVQNMARNLHRRQRTAMMVKLDITKAFDTVSWAFLLEILTYLGFGWRWRTLLCNLFNTSSTRVLLNGEPGQQIRHRRGLRQGDPLSPMLFIIVMDVFSRIIDKADNLKLLAPLATAQIGHRVSIYADDVVLFATSQPGDTDLIKGVLHVFGEASGLRANLQKSSIMPIRCGDTEREFLQEQMACTIASFPCKYLWFPLSLRRLSKADLQPILDKIADALPSWKAALMATSGRLVLVWAVLTSIPIYLLIALDVPKYFIKAVDKFRRSFLWTGRRDLQGGHCLVNWSVS